MKRGRIVRMDEWDKFPKRRRLQGASIPLCDLKPHTAIHRIGSIHYVSQYRRTKTGTPFAELKRSRAAARLFAESAAAFLRSFIADLSGWAIVTTPRRRHHDGFHFSTEVCSLVAADLGIPFHPDAVVCTDRKRIDPDFYQLSHVGERRIIVYDDIVTTGSTLTATARLFADREMVLCLVGISNR